MTQSGADHVLAARGPGTVPDLTARNAPRLVRDPQPQSGLPDASVCGLPQRSGGLATGATTRVHRKRALAPECQEPLPVSTLTHIGPRSRCAPVQHADACHLRGKPTDDAKFFESCPKIARPELTPTEVTGGRRGEKIERRGDESQIEKSVASAFQTAVQSPLQSKSR